MDPARPQPAGAPGVDSELRGDVARALAAAPTRDGGRVVVMATAAVPPALTVLSTADVWTDGETVRVALHGGTAAAERLGGAFALLVPDDARALRVEVVDATAQARGPLVLIEGRLAAIRPTAEPPWGIELRFVAAPGAPVAGFLRYWEAVRTWLAAGATGQAPTPEY